MPTFKPRLKKSTFTIATAYGARQVTGCANKHFGVHLEGGETYNVTHLTSGYRIASSERYARACYIAEALANLAIDWSDPALIQSCRIVIEDIIDQMKEPTHA